MIVVFGVDGVRLDTLRQAHTPNIDAISAAGFLAEFELTAEAATMSGPTWATVLTGMWPRMHGVYGNRMYGNRTDVFPDFLSRARQKGKKTYLATSWSPLVTKEWGGPILDAPTWSTFINGDDLDYSEVDDALAEDAARVLSTRDIDAAFVYLGNPDHVAHHEGTGQSYVDAIERADRHIGQIAPLATEIIVVTDHGHLDGGGHGGRSKWERTAWVAANIPGGDSASHSDSVSHVDIAPTVLKTLGLPIYAEDGFCGQAW